MKYGIALLICGMLIGCAEENTKDISTEDRNFIQTYSGLTKTAWCAEKDDDKDGAIGSYVFKYDGTAEWLGFKPATNEIYARKSFQWSLNADLLQVDDEIGTSEGQKVTIEKQGPKLIRMRWVAVSINLAENGKTTFMAVPCTLPELTK